MLDAVKRRVKVVEGDRGWSTHGRLPARTFVALVGLCGVFGVSATADASPWTMREGGLAVTAGTDFTYAQSEWVTLPDQGSTLQSYPLNGQSYIGQLRFSTRYGVTERFEIGGGITFGLVHFAADAFERRTIFANELEAGDLTPDLISDAPLIEVADAAFGLGDARVVTRYRLTALGRVVAAIELGAKFPTGYRAPAGTFVGDDPVQGEVLGGVALGDGQTDVDLLFLLGAVPARGLFMRVDGGMRFRFFGPGQQVIGAFKTGYRLAPAVLPYVNLDLVYTVTDGATYGVSVATPVPETAAADFRTSDLALIPFTLDRSRLSVGGGVLFTAGGRDVDLAYNGVVWGKNAAQSHTVSLSTTFAFSARGSE